ncbi:MAG: T9SS type A sorting domain-containing protein [Patescibacteria group bacterium]|nr:T9SS type A sorting domain-containing protein [Patescibacteria group bacterium]
MERAIKSFLILAVFTSAICAAGIKGLCYSPFHSGQSPNGASPADSQMVADIVKVKTIVPRIRTFGIDTDYLKRIPAICESLSVNYIVSGWTSFSYSNTWAQAQNDLAAFLKKADSLKYSHCEAVMYGYDNSFDNSYTSEAAVVASLKTYINTCKAAIRPFKVKLTHEENWDVYCRHPDLADSLDFVSIRIMPQDDGIKASIAAAYVQQCYDSVKSHFPNKEVKVTSVGWATSASCESEQKLFLESLTANATFDYFLFEFTDENWKGGTAASYGLVTDLRQPKLFLDSSSGLLNLSNFFPTDTLRLDGIVYDHRSFGYASGISLPALEKQIGYWADTLKEIAKYTIFNSGDLSAANGQLVKIFSDNGNSVGLFDKTVLEPGVKKADATSLSSRMIFSNIESQLGDYGRSDSLARQRTLDNIRHNISVLRQSLPGDSVFVGAYVTTANTAYADSLLKYPEILKSYDGVMLETFLGSYYFSGITNIDHYVDSLIGNFQAKLPGKKLMINMGINSFDGSSNSPNMSTYLAFRKARAKYGYFMFFNDISYFYDYTMTKPSALYKYLMPWRFAAGVKSPFLTQGRGQLFRVNGERIFVGDVEKGASLKIFDLRGRMVREAIIGHNSSFNIEASGLSAGTFIFKLKAGTENLTTKIVLRK